MITSDEVKTFFRNRNICRDTDVKTQDEPKHLGLGSDKRRLIHHSNASDKRMRYCKTQAAIHETNQYIKDKIQMRLKHVKCLKLTQCQGTVIKKHYSHETATTTRTTVLQQVSKRWVNKPSGLILSARDTSVSTQNKHLAMTQSWGTRHDETWKLETAKTRQVSRLRQDRDMKKHASRHVPWDSITDYNTR